MKKPSALKTVFPVLLCALVLSACVMQSNFMREEVADRVAHPAWMIKRPIPASPFLLTSYERMHERHAPAHIYIEGEGATWTLNGDAPKNPTPQNPVALHMASKDLVDNIAYIARPCQYTGMLDPDSACDPALWTDGQFTPEVLAAYNKAIDDIKAHYDITNLHLIGFSGGGVIAAMLAEQRKDVLSLRTVASPLDQVEPINAALRNMPQHHFIGGQDQVVSPAPLHSYLQRLGETGCADYTFIQEAEHEKGWVDKWPELLEKTPECHAPVALPAFEDFVPLPEPVFVTREKPAKP